MDKYSHPEYHWLIQHSVDGRLALDQQQALETHLAGCAECRQYASELRALETQLASVSITRHLPPASRQASLITDIQKRYRRYQRNKQILSFAGTLVALAAVVALVLLFGHIVPRQSTPAVAPTGTTQNETPTLTISMTTPTTENQSLRFFTRAPSDQLQGQDWQLTPYSGASLRDSGLPMNLTEAEAEQQAGFTVLEPTGSPVVGKTNLKGASYDPQLKIVRLFYYSGFVLREERLKTNDDCNLCGIVGANAPVEAVRITGDVMGEYVVGIWRLTGDKAVWEPDPYMKRMRWQANGMAYELMYNPTYDPDAFNLTDMLAIAKSITYVDLTSVEAQVGYPVKALASLPTGYVFSRAEVNQPTNSVCLVYEYTGNGAPGPELWLAQGPMATAPGLVAQPGFADTRQTPVAIGGAQNAFSLSGVQRDGAWACVQPQNATGPALRLTWQADGQQFDLYALSNSCMMEEGYTDLHLLRLAEVVTGVSTRPKENHDLDVECERYQVGEMEDLAGFKVRYPQGYPDGMRFYGLSYGVEPAKQISQYYRSQDSNHTGLIIREMPVNPEAGDDLASQVRDLAANAYQSLTIAGNPAILIQGGWTMDEQGNLVWQQGSGVGPTLWFENKGLLIAINEPWLTEPGDDLQEKLTGVAESIAGTDLTIAEAENLAGFKVLEPASNLIPPFFYGASYDPELKLVRYSYLDNTPGSVDGFSNSLSISQQLAANGVDCELCGFVVGDSAAAETDYSGKVVGANAIQLVQIGDSTGEYVEGIWTGSHNNGIWAWESEPDAKALRWQANGMAFELRSWSSDINKDTLIAIAESLSPASQAEADRLAAVEAQVGYTPKTRLSLPAGYVFSTIEVDQPTNSVCVKYNYTGNDGPGPELWLAQGPLANTPGLAAVSGYAQTRQTPVVVNGGQQAYALSGMQRGGQGPGRGGEWACTQSQTDSTPPLRLTWQAEGQQYDLYAMPGKCMLEEGLSDLDLLRLAERLTGMPIRADQADPECSPDISMIESLTGFTALQPQNVPGGLEFYGASASKVPAQEIGMYYRLPGSNHSGLVIQEMQADVELGNDLASQIRGLPADGFQTLTIAGAPAAIILGNWTTNDQGEKVWLQGPGVAPSLWLERNGLLISISGPWLAEAENPQSDLTAIAESLLDNHSAVNSPETQAVEAQAGFDITNPDWLPTDYQYSASSYNSEKNTVCLSYRSPGDGSQPSLVVVQSPYPLPGIEELRAPFYNGASYPTPYTLNVPIGGASDAQGSYYAQNAFDASRLCGGESWKLYQALYWQSGNANFAILSNPVIAGAQGTVTQLEIRRMAESITGVSTIPTDAVDPERMPSIQVAENLLGIDLLEVDYLPAGNSFLFAAYFERDSTRLVQLFYTNNMHILIDLGSELTSLEEEYNQAQQLYEKATVRGKEALFSPGICQDENGGLYTENCGTPQSLTWFENGLRYRIEGFMAKEDMLAIAESMR